MPEMPRNAFKHALAAGKLQIGLWSSLCSNIAAEIIGDSGFDWILLDTEHSPNEIPDLVTQLQAIQAGTATPIIRPAWNDAVLAKRCLDIGAQTLLFPYVQNAEEAKRAVASTRYPPQGIRGVSVARARQPLWPRAGLSDQGQRRDLRAGAGRDRASRSTSSKPSPASRASTASSSARPISPPRSAISAIRSMPRCRRRCRTRSSG